MRPLLLALALVALPSCGPDNLAPGDGDGGVGIDAGTTGNVSCQTYVYEERLNGRVVERQTNRVAHVANVNPSDDFTVVYCNYIPASGVTVGGCTAGRTCSGTTGPTGPACRTETQGNFISDKLVISCGGVWDFFDQNGALTARYGGDWQSIRVTVH